MEPPCRQRRLEPWRQRIREECAREADAHCPVPTREGSPLQVLLRNTAEERAMRDRNPIPPGSPHSMVAPPSTLFDLSREMDSLFDSLFAPPQQRSMEVGGSNNREAEDPFEAIFDSMMGFSLRAFDRMMLTTMDAEPAVTPSMGATPMAGIDVEEKIDGFPVEGPPAKVGGGAGHYDEDETSLDEDLSSSDFHRKREIPIAEDEEDEGKGYPWGDEDFGGYDDYVSENSFATSASLDGVVSEDGEDEVAPTTPEQAAENALDVMVANLAQRAVMHATPVSEEAVAMHRAQQEKDDAEEAAFEIAEDAGEAGSTEEVGGPPVISIENLPQRLFEMGNLLLVEAGSRRRLQEADDGKIDPHLQVKERLARRLTEYRTDLFYHPDGTVTVYTSGSSGMPSPFMKPHHVIPPRPQLMNHLQPSAFPPPASESPLGMGSRHLDQCTKSRFDNGDLEGACHQAVQQFYLALDDRTMVPPAPRMMEPLIEKRTRTTNVHAEYHHEIAGVNAGTVCLFAGVFALLALVLNPICLACDEDEARKI